MRSLRLLPLLLLSGCVTASSYEAQVHMRVEAEQRAAAAESHARIAQSEASDWRAFATRETKRADAAEHRATFAEDRPDLYAGLIAALAFAVIELGVIAFLFGMNPHIRQILNRCGVEYHTEASTTELIDGCKSNRCVTR